MIINFNILRSLLDERGIKSFYYVSAINDGDENNSTLYTVNFFDGVNENKIGTIKLYKNPNTCSLSKEICICDFVRFSIKNKLIYYLDIDNYRVKYLNGRINPNIHRQHVDTCDIYNFIQVE